MFGLFHLLPNIFKGKYPTLIWHQTLNHFHLLSLLNYFPLTLDISFPVIDHDFGGIIALLL